MAVTTSVPSVADIQAPVSVHTGRNERENERERTCKRAGPMCEIGSAESRLPRSDHLEIQIISNKAGDSS
jgi:hypothetical protein